MICERCNNTIAPGEELSHGALRVCEDCAMDLLSPAKACDPWAVKLAKGSFTSKADAASTLRGPEKELYELVKKRRRVSVEEAKESLSLGQNEIQKVFSVLRHMELLRGSKRADGGVDLLLFDDDGKTGGK
ncbi:hypothetical protein EPN96_12500 [bacterium]|nr:MAG: hypothetical protein EPN96_12500 [bacterium]